MSVCVGVCVCVRTSELQISPDVTPPLEAMHTEGKGHIDRASGRLVLLCERFELRAYTGCQFGQTHACANIYDQMQFR